MNFLLEWLMEERYKFYIQHGSYYEKYLTGYEQDSNLYKTRVKALLNEVMHAVVITTTPQHRENTKKNATENKLSSGPWHHLSEDLIRI